MQKIPPRPKQDRSLSVDIGNAMLPLAHSPNYANIPESKRQHSIHRSSPSMNSNRHGYLQNVLGEQVVNFAHNSSPSGANRSRKNSISGQNSNIRQRSTSKPKKNDQSMMNMSNLESESTVVLNNAIQQAYNLQIEKEKQLSQAQTKTEKELTSLKTKAEELDKSVKMHRDKVDYKHSSILSLVQEIEGVFLRSGSLQNRGKAGHIDGERQKFNFFRNVAGSQQELERKEMIKMIVNMNKDLSSDFKVLENLIKDESGSCLSSLNHISLRSVVSSKEESLKHLSNEKSLLIQKMYDIEEKLNETKETKMMIAEDIHSHIVSLTECVVLQEEMDFVLESLRSQNPEYYEKIFQELELHDKIIALGFKIKKKEDDLKQLVKDSSVDEEKHSQLLEEAHRALIEIESLRDLESARKRDIIHPKITIWQKVKDFIKGIPGSSDASWAEELEGYLKLFKPDERVKQSYGESEVKIIEYEGQILQEMHVVLQIKQEIDSFENTLLQLHLDSKKAYMTIDEVAKYKKDPKLDIAAVTKNLQDEIINRKLGLTEKIVNFGFSKVRIINSIPGNVSAQKVLLDHSKLSFFDIVKNIAAELNPQVFQRLSEMMLSTIKNFRNQVDEYHNAQVKGQKKSEGLRGLNRVVQEVKKKVNENNSKIQQETAKLRAIKEEEALYRHQCEMLEESCRTEIASEAQKAYLNYAQEHEKHLKKLKFQYGKNFVTKLTTTIMEDYIHSNTSILNKFKEDIKDAYRMTVKMEEYRAKTSIKIETELKKAFEETKVLMKQYEDKLSLMNEELLSIMEKERKLTRSTGQPSSQNNITSEAREEGDGLTEAEYLYADLQNYKGRVSSLMRNIVQALTIVQKKGDVLSFAEKEKVLKMMGKLHEDLYSLMNNDIKALEQVEREGKEHQGLVKDKEAKLTYCKDQLQKSQHFYEVSNELLKKKESPSPLPPTTPVMTPVMHPVMNPIPRPERKAMSSSKQRLKGHLNNSRSVSKLNINLKENIEPDRSIEHSIASISTTRNAGSKFIPPKIGLDPSKLWSHGSRSRGASHSMSKSPSMIDFSSLTGQNINIDMSGQKTTKRGKHASMALVDATLYQSTPKQEKPPVSSSKAFSLSKSQYGELMKDFEEGIPVYKKLNPNTSLDVKDINVKNEKTHDIKGFGKRMLKLNTQGKSIDVIKAQANLLRPTPEYSYQWKSIKKIHLPPVTLKAMKAMLSEDKLNTESGEMLHFCLEIAEKGKIDFLVSHVGHLALLYSVVNQIVSHGKVNMPVREDKGLITLTLKYE